MEFEIDSPIPSDRGEAVRGNRLRAAVATAVAAGALFAFGAGTAGAQSISDLNSKIAGAQSQAQSMSADVQAKADQVAAAQQQAAAAAQREAELSNLLAEGQQRSADLAVKVEQTQSHLQRARAHLKRALGDLQARLVDIYKSGAPNAAEILLNAHGFRDLANRANMIGRIENSDADLAKRVRSLRNQVKDALNSVRQAKAQQDAYNARVSDARDQIASVRATAEQQAAIATLQSNVSSWENQVQQIQAAQAAAAQQAQEAQQASAASAQQTVANWVGNWAIPQAIVMCESGGNFNAVNPSSGAGGAYQILPSTWRLYGGSGAPQDGSPAEQSNIAAQIWADSGPSAWVCAQ